MKAVTFKSKDQPLQFTEVPDPVPKEGEVVIQLKYASLNHLDLWIQKEQVSEKEVILGSDGSGIVSQIGKGVEASLLGKEVIINPSLYWGNNPLMYSNEYQILGYPTNGTFAEAIVVPQAYVHIKPAHLRFDEAAALPMAALTAYRALFTKAGVTAGDNVLISGIGGGVALFALQLAIATGAHVYVTSGNEQKIAKAIALGAVNGFNYKQPAWVTTAKQQAGGFDVIIDSAGGNGFTSLIEVANAGARIVLFGKTAGPINGLSPSPIYNKQLQIMGTVMGTPQEFSDMLSFYATHRLRPVIDQTFDLDRIHDAFQYLENGQHFGKVLLHIHT